jgi:hypothetical protein
MSDASSRQFRGSVLHVSPMLRIPARPVPLPRSCRDTVDVVANKTAAPPQRKNYPGQDLGLPQAGAGSVAPMARRFGALLVDWLLCLLIARGLLHSAGWTIVVFAVEAYLLTAISGLTVGKRIFGIRAIPLTGGRIGFRWAALRVILLLAVVPPLITDRDLRGLHDRAANTVVVRL